MLWDYFQDHRRDGVIEMRIEAASTINEKDFFLNYLRCLDLFPIREKDIAVGIPEIHRKIIILMRDGAEKGIRVHGHDSIF
ncbi:hypothetical protein CLLU_21810 [Clostridium luticellarii]|jgi:hypothetical protein|uniref:Uncharacterized protein n=2 Tax=Clostridium luticellarii TaxID=1691940 RepID=A0A2T0BLU9_9CLOT|nr:hypothetical protein CLLU_21810 [Clostridium luticellarii]